MIHGRKACLRLRLRNVLPPSHLWVPAKVACALEVAPADAQKASHITASGQAALAQAKLQRLMAAHRKSSEAVLSSISQACSRAGALQLTDDQQKLLELLGGMKPDLKLLNIHERAVPVARAVLQPTGFAAEQDSPDVGGCQDIANAATSVLHQLITAELHAAREWCDKPGSLNAAAAPALGHSQGTGGGLPSHRAAEDDSARHASQRQRHRGN